MRSAVVVMITVVSSSFVMMLFLFTLTKVTTAGSHHRHNTPILYFRSWYETQDNGGGSGFFPSLMPFPPSPVPSFPTATEGTTLWSTSAPAPTASNTMTSSSSPLPADDTTNPTNGYGGLPSGPTSTSIPSFPAPSLLPPSGTPSFPSPSLSSSPLSTIVPPGGTPPFTSTTTFNDPGPGCFALGSSFGSSGISYLMLSGQYDVQLIGNGNYVTSSLFPSCPVSEQTMTSCTADVNPCSYLQINQGSTVIAKIYGNDSNVLTGTFTVPSSSTNDYSPISFSFRNPPTGSYNISGVADGSMVLNVTPASSS